ncbi:hypothetical protein, partial [Nocardia sp. NPDC050413]|uniref:hypothetical protein n=1 Tax=Nocardia sp. NPDC050413 TaxID=3155784 RepID=UPI003404DAF7
GLGQALVREREADAIEKVGRAEAAVLRRRRESRALFARPSRGRARARQRSKNTAQYLCGAQNTKVVPYNWDPTT